MKSKKYHMACVVTVRAKSKEEAKDKLTKLMNRATCGLDINDEFPEWGFWDEYKSVGEKVRK